MGEVVFVKDYLIELILLFVGITFVLHITRGNHL